MKVLLVLLALLSGPLDAQESGERELSYTQINEHYRRAERLGKAEGAVYAELLERIAFRSVSSPAAGVVERADSLVRSEGLNLAIPQLRLPVSDSTDAFSLLGELALEEQQPERARQLLSFAVLQRATTLLDALRSEPIGFTYTTLSDALITARNVRHVFKSLNQLDVERDPNLFRDLYNLAIALEQSGYPERSRMVLGLLAEEPAAGVFFSPGRSAP